METSELIERQICEQATGCSGAGGYRAWATQNGYPHLEVMDRTSSAGDWTFVVSQDGSLWFPMYQTNNYPRPGFTWTVDESLPFEGTGDEALSALWEVA